MGILKTFFCRVILLPGGTRNLEPDNQLGTSAEPLPIEQSLQTLHKILFQTNNVQADNASVKQLVSAFPKIK